MFKDKLFDLQGLSSWCSRPSCFNGCLLYVAIIDVVLKCICDVAYMKGLNYLDVHFSRGFCHQNHVNVVWYFQLTKVLVFCSLLVFSFVDLSEKPWTLYCLVMKVFFMFSVVLLTKILNHWMKRMVFLICFNWYFYNNILEIPTSYAKTLMFYYLRWKVIVRFVDIGKNCWPV
jgi:hypothetical protein